MTKEIQEITIFNALRDLCGLKNQDIAAWLKVSIDTVKSWSSHRTKVPDRVVRKLSLLREDQLKAFHEEESRVKVQSKKLHAPDVIELKLQDVDSKPFSSRRYWPCTNAHLRVLAMVIAKYPDLKFKIVAQTDP